MRLDEVSKLINELIANLSFHADYASFLPEYSKLLLVEGSTDKTFVESVVKENVICIVADKAFKANLGFYQDRANCKRAIIEVVSATSKYPIEFLKVPKGFESLIGESGIMGMVDLDYDSITDPKYALKHLFVTDTHDLETLLISSDNHIFENIPGITVLQNELDLSVYLAYQIALLRECLYDLNPDLDFDVISGGSRINVDYDCFVSDSEVGISELLVYIYDRSNEKLSDAKKNTLIKKIVADKRLKKLIDKEGHWISIESFNDKVEMSEVWGEVNGHDILCLLRYINSEAEQKYGNPNSKGLNRKFEEDLIKSYDYSCFSSTSICKKMMGDDICR